MAIRRRATTARPQSPATPADHSAASEGPDSSGVTSRSTKNAIRDILRRYRATFERLAR